MSNATDLAMVIELACLTEDRSNEEQHALLRVAWRLDNELNAQVVTNKRTGPPSRLLELVEGTRQLDVGCQRAVSLPAKQRETWLRRVERWDGGLFANAATTPQRPVATETTGEAL